MAGTNGSTLPTRAEASPERVSGCADLVRAHRWERTPLGPRDRWDPMLRATAELILASPMP